MIPQGTFMIGPYECYVGAFDLQRVTVILVDTLPVLEAGNAASTVGRILNSSNIRLDSVSTGRGSRFCCMIKDVLISTLERVSNENEY